MGSLVDPLPGPGILHGGEQKTKEKWVSIWNSVLLLVLPPDSGAGCFQGWLTQYLKNVTVVGQLF